MYYEVFLRRLISFSFVQRSFRITTAQHPKICNEWVASNNKHLFMYRASQILPRIKNPRCASLTQIALAIAMLTLAVFKKKPVTIILLEENLSLVPQLQTKSQSVPARHSTAVVNSAITHSHPVPEFCTGHWFRFAVLINCNVGITLGAKPALFRAGDTPFEIAMLSTSFLGHLEGHDLLGPRVRGFG